MEGLLPPGDKYDKVRWSRDGGGDECSKVFFAAVLLGGKARSPLPLTLPPPSPPQGDTRTSEYKYEYIKKQQDRRTGGATMRPPPPTCVRAA